jgi:hypothetical protein
MASIKTKAKREAKKFAKKHTGFVVALIVTLILGLALGLGAGFMVNGKDEFTLYNNGKALQDATIYLQSGQTYNVDAEENKTKVVVWGKDVSNYVKYTIKYINEESGEVEIVTEFSKDGTYCIIYELDYSGDFLTEFIAKKYEKVKLRKTVIIGGNE